MDPDSSPPTADPTPEAPVDAIFARAERVFERRVDQLLALKRAKARVAGTPFNARKAKRDARTVAGREKLDALVRRLADLATLQQRALGAARAGDDAKQLDAAAAALLGFAALRQHLALPAQDDAADDDLAAHHPRPQHAPPSPPPYTQRHVHISPVSPAVHPPARMGPDEAEHAREMLDTSSCSDDASMTAAASWHTLRDIREELDLDTCEQRACETRGRAWRKDDATLFHATQSVVNFVLEGDEDMLHRKHDMQAQGRAQGRGGVRAAPTPRYAALQVGARPYDQYEEHHGVNGMEHEAYDYRSMPPPRADWPRRRQDFLPPSHSVPTSTL